MTSTTRRHRAAGGLLAAIVLVAVACVPDPGTGPTTTTTTIVGSAPTISAFSAATPSGPSPLTTAFQWTIADADGDPLTCSLDTDGDLIDDETIATCTSDSLRAATLDAVGVTTARLRVSDGNNVTTATTTVTVTAPATDTYDVDLVVTGTFTWAQRAELDAAAARIEGIVRGGLPDSTLTVGPGDCVIGTTPYSGPVDDLLVLVEALPLPGSGEAQAAVCGTQTTPAGIEFTTGCMTQFDSEVLPLLAPGELEDLATHEFLHCVGLGSGFGRWGSLSGNFTGTDPRWSGLTGRAEWQQLGGTGRPPLEIGRGPGSDYTHWRESVVGNEVMTSVVGDSPMPVSRLTIAALADLGFTVDLGAADPYSLPAPAFRAAASIATPVEDFR